MQKTHVQQLPIGIFDSGMGGLTVLKALKSLLPHESFIYLGDTARLPYGIKSQQTVEQYALQAVNFLHDLQVKMLVIACNTASAYALPAIKQHLQDIPVIGVVEAGAAAAVRQSSNKHVIVLATEATVRAGAYKTAIQAIDPNFRIIEKPCSLFVALAEEGWTNNYIAEAVAREYIEPLMQTEAAKTADCVVLGCTHFPVFSQVLHTVLGPSICLVDSAAVVAKTVHKILSENHLSQVESVAGQLFFYVTDLPERFARVGHYFMDLPLNTFEIKLISL